ncbi:CBS domain-containing protein [Guggenheimella bovis]
MFVRAIMTPKSDLTTVTSDATLGDALKIINEKGFLSLPVVDGTDFVGYITKQYIYEKFVELGCQSYEEFLKTPIKGATEMSIDPIDEGTYVENAAEIFFNNKARFIPVIDKQNRFQGIVTQRSIFELVIRALGLKDAKITILSDNFVGTLARISDIIQSHGANITNITQFQVGFMNTQEIAIRVKGENIEELVEKLKNKGIRVRDYEPSKLVK